MEQQLKSHSRTDTPVICVLLHLKQAPPQLPAASRLLAAAYITLFPLFFFFLYKQIPPNFYVLYDLVLEADHLTVCDAPPKQKLRLFFQILGSSPWVLQRAL